MKQRLIVIHGFAGHPDDWSQFENSFPEWPLHKINLFEKRPLPLEQWAEQTLVELRRFEGRQILLGYSMGGRLAAHLLLRAPELFGAAVFVSTHPGLVTQQERDERQVADARWAEKWKTAAWPVLQAEWNAQSVFQSKYSKPQPHRETDFDREILAQAMTTWSLGQQANLRPGLEALMQRQLWVAGEDDLKFVKLSEEMATRSDRSDAVIVPWAGHRVPWDNPSGFVTAVRSFLDLL